MYRERVHGPTQSHPGHHWLEDRTNHITRIIFPMSFLKEIISDIGDEHVNYASTIDETEEYLDSGCYIFNALYLVVSMVAFLVIRLLQSLVNPTGKTFFSLPLSVTFSITILMVLFYTLTLSQPSLVHF